ncbi:MAG: hypothetical protein GVY04_10315 [Cyanobacteria bacterium]|jgi:hypothetical protein|nr:hypothetical protein [Cyanobacteria bacterium GSL.Bin1]
MAEKAVRRIEAQSVFGKERGARSLFVWKGEKRDRCLGKERKARSLFEEGEGSAIVVFGKGREGAIVVFGKEGKARSVFRKERGARSLFMWKGEKRDRVF